MRTEYITRDQLSTEILDELIKHYQLIEEDKISKLQSILRTSSSDDLYRILNMIDRFGIEIFDLIVARGI